jgi:cysteine-rich repeat protein
MSDPLLPEECDDGNIQGGDGCTEFCLIEPAWTCAPINCDC